MSARWSCFVLALLIGGVTFAEEERKLGAPKVAKVIWTFSNSSSGTLELYLTYQQKKNRNVEEHFCASIAPGTSRKAKEVVIYNGLVGPAGKDGGFRIFQPGASAPIAEKLFFVSAGIGHNPKGNLINPDKEQIDIAALEDPDLRIVISINPLHK